MRFRMVVIVVCVLQTLFFMTACEQVKEFRIKAYYEKAHKLYEAQDYRAALKEIQYALEFNADHPDALALQGMCHYELKNFEKAALCLEHAMRIGGEQKNLSLKAADSWLKEGTYARTILMTEQLLAAEPGNVHARYTNVKARLRSRRVKNWSGVVSILQPLLSSQEYTYEAFALLAEFHILNDNLAEAELILTQHAHLNEDWLFVVHFLLRKYFDQGDDVSAERIYRKLLELKPDSLADADSLLTMLRKSGRREDELQLLESLVSADEGQIRYKLKLIDFNMYYGRFDKAEQQIQAGLRQGDGYGDFSRRLIDLYEKTGRWKEAVACAKDVLARVGDDPAREVEFMNILARLYYLQDNPALAKFVIRWILSFDRNNHEARFLLARMSLDEGRTLLAIAELRGLGSEEIENPDYDYYMGLAHMARAEYSNAEQSFKEALKKQPAYKPALLKLADLFFKRGRLLDVESMINAFLSSTPGDPDVLALQAELAKKTVPAPEAG